MTFLDISDIFSNNISDNILDSFHSALEFLGKALFLFFIVKIVFWNNVMFLLLFNIFIYLSLSIYLSNKKNGGGGDEDEMALK